MTMTQYGRPFSPFFWHCKYCKIRLSEHVRTEEDLWEHDRIWHKKGTIEYFTYLERLITKYGTTTYREVKTGKIMVVRH